VSDHPESRVESTKLSKFIPPSVTTPNALQFAKFMLNDLAYFQKEIIEPNISELKFALEEAELEEDQLKQMGHIHLEGSNKRFIQQSLNETLSYVNPLPTPTTTAETISSNSHDSTSSYNYTVGNRSDDPAKQTIKSPTKAVKKGSISDFKEVSYFFYQAADGQHVYLHPLDIKILKHEYREYNLFPRVLSVIPTLIQESTMTEDLRKRTKYLSHLPLSCDVSFCEVDWSNIISAETLLVFQNELKQRKS
jgi:hypothetical protein